MERVVCVSRTRPRANTHGVKKSSLVVQHSSSIELQQKYKHIHDLGSGAFGRVSLVRDRNNGQQCVCKMVPLATCEPCEVEMVRKEVEVLSTLDHPRIVKLYEYCEDPVQQKLELILEHMPGGTVASLLEVTRAPPSEAFVAKLMYQTLSALAYCHEHGVIHRDVKSENLLLTKSTRIWGSPDCKLIDFGCACRGLPGEVMPGDSVGTTTYMAPEMLFSKPYTNKADVWSVGVIAFELLAGCLPFGASDGGESISFYDHAFTDFETFAEAEADLGRSWRWPWRSSEAHEFVGALLTVDASLRPSSAEAVEDLWLQQHDDQECKFTKKTLQSLEAYMRLPPIARCCLLIIATRTNVPNSEKIGNAFACADADGDGKLSYDELVGAVEEMKESQRSRENKIEIDLNKLLMAADLDHTGAMEYTEFVAACICSHFDTFDDLVQNAFCALDADHDGLVNMSQLRNFFRERDAPLLALLPQNRPFSQTEWCTCMLSHQAAVKDMFHQRGPDFQTSSHAWSVRSCYPQGKIMVRISKNICTEASI